MHSYMKRHGCMRIHADGTSALETSNGGMSGYGPSTCDVFAQGTRVFTDSWTGKHPCKALRRVLRASRSSNCLSGSEAIR